MLDLDPPRRCPECGERTLVPVAMGLPDEELVDAAQRGEVVLGGCCTMPGLDPERQCTACGWAQRPPAPDEGFWMCGTPDEIDRMLGVATVIDAAGPDAERSSPIDHADVDAQLRAGIDQAEALALGAHAALGLALQAERLAEEVSAVRLPPGGRRLVDRHAAGLAGAAERLGEAADGAARAARRLAELRAVVRRAPQGATGTADVAAGPLDEAAERVATAELHLAIGERLAVDAAGDALTAATALVRVALGAAVLGDDPGGATAGRLIHQALAVATTTDVGLPPVDDLAWRTGRGRLGTRPPLTATDADELRAEVAGVLGRVLCLPTTGWALHTRGDQLGAIRVAPVAGGIALRHEPPGWWRSDDPGWHRVDADDHDALRAAVDRLAATVAGTSDWADGEVTAIVDGLADVDLAALGPPGGGGPSG